MGAPFTAIPTLRSAPRVAAVLALSACAAPDPAPSGAIVDHPDRPLSAAYLALLHPAPDPPGSPPLSPRAAAHLAADLAAHTRAATASSTPPPRVIPGPPPFVFAAGDPNAPLDAAIPLANRLVDFLYAPTGPFAHRCEKAVTVWLYASPGAFAHGWYAHARDRGEPPGLGLYDPSARAVVARADPGAGLTTLLHELTHPLLGDCDFPLAPRWIDEGIASLFELPDLSRPGEIHFKAHFRLQTLRTELASPGTTRPVPGIPTDVRLENLFEGRPAAFSAEYGTQALYGALAREALRWLDTRGQLWPFYRAFRDGVLDDPKGAAAFARAVGKTPAEATPEWVAWIRSKDAEAPR